jgi:thiosulfate/3-mercaptopyruvate sulfurtransferase
MTFETLIDTESLRSLLKSKDRPLLLDCRFDLGDPEAGHRAYLQGHIPTARFADLNRDLAAAITASSGRHPLPAPDVFAATLSAWGLTAGRQVVAYDAANASFAARLWWMLRWVGHRASAVLDGGLHAWTTEGGELSSGEESPPAAGIGGFKAALDPSFATVSADAVSESLSHHRHIVIDARAPERYSGAVEPIDSLAGHIPGALNHPFATNLGADGKFLPPEELKRRWLKRLNGRPADEVVASCGSGVTACHNLLSLKIAGLSGAKLYPGSWSEWIRDPNRPVARGDAP